jgi:hypothetical protein
MPWANHKPTKLMPINSFFILNQFILPVILINSYILIFMVWMDIEYPHTST